MSDTLVVHVNRDRLHAVEVETSFFRATGSFAVVLENHGPSTHVHIHLDDELSRAASLEANNRYVDAESTTEVPVKVDDGRRPSSGKLKLVTGYGAHTTYVDVELVEPEETDRYVRVDETLAKPKPKPRKPDSDLLDGGTLVQNGIIAALGGFALLLAVGVASITRSDAVLVGTFAVLVGVGLAALLLVRQ